MASLRAISAILQGYHPGFFPAYIKPRRDRREWTRATTASTRRARSASCWRTPASKSARLETGEFRDVPHPEYGWVRHLLERYRLETDLRGDGIYAVGRKTGPVKRALPGVAVRMSAGTGKPK